MKLGDLHREPVGEIRGRELPSSDGKGRFQIRAFTPSLEGEADGAPTPHGRNGRKPDAGWPCLVWFHGGGFVMGGLDSENSFLSMVCNRVRCVVVSVNYRHAPEDPYPAAVEDAVSGLEWVVSGEGREWLQIDRQRVAVGGLSAGGCLAAVVGMKAAELELEVKLRGQLLVCPVIDNTATVEGDGVWKESRHAPWLTPARMTWYREMYFPSEAGKSAAANWDASPCFAPEELLAKSPRTWIAVAECDLLAPEERAFAAKLRDSGVEVEVRVYEGATHSVLVLAGVLKIGRRLVEDFCDALKEGLR
jgi:acetyl esterase/lipase